MANIKTFMDVLPGSIVVSDMGTEYVVLVDDAGNRGLFSHRGTWIRPNDGELTFGKNHMSVSKVLEFDTLPVLDRVSEGIKYIYTDRVSCAPLTVCYTSEPQCVTEAKRKIADMEAEIKRQEAIIQRYAR